MLDPLLFASAPPAHLPGVLHSLEPTLDRFGYLALGLVFLEDFGVPVPGETVLIIAAVYAGTGRLNIWLVALIAFIAAILGDNVGFGIGHFGGRPLAERYGKYIFLTPERLDKTASFFDRHGGKVIVIARFVEGLRQANGIIAGITGMHWRKFAIFNALGAALWVGVWVSIGYFSGSNIDTIYNTAVRYEAYFGIAVGVVLLAFIGHRVWRWRREKREKASRKDEAGGRESGRDDEVGEPKSGRDEQAGTPEGSPVEAAAEPEGSRDERAGPPDSSPAEAAGQPESSRDEQAEPPESSRDDEAANPRSGGNEEARAP